MTAPERPRSVTIVGASLAGHATARALRAQGHAGSLTIVGEEVHRPYDRPPLSKEYLAGTIGDDDLLLQRDGEDLGARWLTGTRAVALDAMSRTVTLDDGRTLSSDAVVIATGATNRSLDTCLSGVHSLRTIDDARRLRADLHPGARLVVVGGGFVGLEVAATARTLGVEVTVVSREAPPLSRLFGAEIGHALAAHHGRLGVTLLTGCAAAGYVGDVSAGRGRVTAVALADGRTLAADLVLAGIGADPATSWLRGSGLDISDGVVCDENGRTGRQGVYAIGDCAAWFDPVFGRNRRIDHWQVARDRAAVLAAAMMTGRRQPPLARPAYLWSTQGGLTLQFVGQLRGGESATVEAGSVAGGDPLVLYRGGGRVVAAAGINQPRAMVRLRKELARATAATVVDTAAGPAASATAATSAVAM